MARHDEYEREQAAKVCQYAEELFLAGNVSGAHRQASKAQRLCPSLPGVANALAAYEVLLASKGGGWRAVLGVRPGGGGVAPDAIKKQYRRLSLLVHPDKARCAAAEAAFKLVRDACEKALDSAGDTRPAAPEPPPRAATPPRCYEPNPMGVPRVRMLIYCPSCKNQYAAKIGRLEEHAGMKCGRCPEWLSPPWQKKPPTKKEPAAEAGRKVFQCPASCPECAAPYTSKVCVGKWCLTCKACTKSSMVDVQGPDQATATVKRRA